MKEAIFIIEEFIKDKEMLLKHPCWISERTIQAIENLLTRNKELEQKYSAELDEGLKMSEWLVEKQKKMEEQDKMIDFMIEWIRKRSIYGVYSNDELKEYFKKKVSGKNE